MSKDRGGRVTTDKSMTVELFPDVGGAGGIAHVETEYFLVLLIGGRPTSIARWDKSDRLWLPFNTTNTTTYETREADDGVIEVRAHGLLVARLRCLEWAKSKP
jgi:hypothetical protein